jgi:hypothetical protein
MIITVEKLFKILKSAAATQIDDELCFAQVVDEDGSQLIESDALVCGHIDCSGANIELIRGTIFLTDKYNVEWIIAPFFINEALEA